MLSDTEAVVMVAAAANVTETIVEIESKHAKTVDAVFQSVLLRH